MKSESLRATRVLRSYIPGSNPDTSTNRKIRTSSEVRIFFVIAHFSGFFEMVFCACFVLLCVITYFLRYFEYKNVMKNVMK